MKKNIFLLILFSALTQFSFAQHGGWNHDRHHGNDSIHWGDSSHHHWNDSIKWNDSLSWYNWRDSLPHLFDSLHCRHHNDSIPNDTIHNGGDSLHRHHHHWNDSIPNWGDSSRWHNWNDSLPGDTNHWHHCGGDSLGLDKIKVGSLNSIASINIYPNPVVTTAKLHVENANGNLTFSLYDRTGKAILTLPNVTNGDIQFNKNTLLPGIYFFDLRNNNSLVSNGTVIIQ